MKKAIMIRQYQITIKLSNLILKMPQPIVAEVSPIALKAIMIVRFPIFSIRQAFQATIGSVLWPTHKKSLKTQLFN